ncbi:MAG TPA: response regulator transcription factor [Herpetosiphonaceae bacterium]|jgi:DNA-binding response OmpR family regulator|nr:response regulator transcription factor [Herpetosiphonaceae bacterium]
MSKWRVLIADDDLVIRRSLEASLLMDDFDVISAADGEEALVKVEQRWPDIAVLDLNMPGMSGFKLADRLRRAIEIPVIMLTSVSDEETTVRGIEDHADDYVTKPFRYPELRARINRLLARAYEGGLHPGERVVVDDQLVIDFGHRVAILRDNIINLTPIEARILFILLQNQNRIVPTGTLLRKAWGFGEEGDPSSLWVRMRKLRTKIEPDPDAPRYIQTERGVGYRFARPE